MRSQDWANAENYHNKLVSELMEFCVQRGLSSMAEGNKFTVTLPTVDEINVWPEVEKRKHFDISKWGAKSADDPEPLPDDFQMPDYGEQLEEGQPPKGDPNHEA